MTVREGQRVVGIIGLGLMGGSLARDLSGLGWQVQGTDRDPETERRARESGVAPDPIDPAAVDLLVLAVPVRAAPGWLRRLAPRLGPDTAVTDVGSTKRSVVEAAEAAGLGPRFVGSHPVAGDYRSGWKAGRAGLYREATVWLCPSGESTAEAISRVTAMWQAVGARPERIRADDHDRLLARASHLPQVVATALAAVLAHDGVGPRQLGPGGRNMTRLAGSDPTVWADILVDNHDEVAPALSALIAELTRFRRAVQGLDDASLGSLLAAGRAWSRGERDPEAAVPGADRL